MEATLIGIQIILALLLSISILLQSRGDGMGSMGGSDDSVGDVYSTRRGAEKILYNGTIILAVLFALNALLFPLFV